MDARTAQSIWRRMLGGPAGKPLSPDEAWEAILGGAEGDRARNDLAESLDDTRSWVDPNGYRLSDRIWRARQSDRDAIDRILRESIAEGNDPLATARRLEQYLTPRGRRGTTRSPRSGRGSAAARRLARTETTRAFGQATIEAAKLNPFVRGVRWILSATHDVDNCDGTCADNARRNSRGMGRGEYAPEEVPRYPGHPNCRCFLIAVTIDDDELHARLGLDAFEPRPGVGDLPLDQFARDLIPGPSSAREHLVLGRDGAWRFSPERQALHDALIREFVDGVPVSDDPTIYMLGGGPAAGKTTMLKSGKARIPDPEERAAALVNPDEMKERLPEYGPRVRAGDEGAAGFVHEESSYLAKRVQQAAIERRQDIVIDGVGVNYDRTLKTAGPVGYRVRGFYAYIPDPEVAVQRAVARGAKTGRYVSADTVRAKHIEVAQKFPDAAGKLESIELYDTSDGARLVARGRAGEPLEIIDPEGYAQLQKIGRMKP